MNLGAARLLGTGWPYGTFTVNVVGSFVMGLIVSYLALRGQASQVWLLFLTTGILGGFTTFSAFSLDVAVLFELRKAQPDGEVIGHLMRRFVYTAGITGVMQITTLVIMTTSSVPMPT